MIVIPMAGMSSRFFNAGYSLPKYMLPLWGKSVFHQVMMSFESYFKSEEFVFICRKDTGAVDFIKSEIPFLGIENFQISEIEETNGQAESVVKGLEKFSKKSRILIFNIDTFRPNYRFPSFVFDGSADGYLEVFEGEGSNWSYVKEDDTGQVIETAEKVPISNLCCTGMYYFRELAMLREAYLCAKKTGDYMFKEEYYIAPLYNYLIKSGHKVRYSKIDKSEVIFCGTPDEYALLQGGHID